MDPARKERIEAEFRIAWLEIENIAFQTARSKGFHDKPVDDGTRIALMHSELSEALEALRKDNPPSEHIPNFTAVEEELADTVIRIMDFAALHALSVGSAIIAKMKFNAGRPHMHGGKKF